MSGKMNQYIRLVLTLCSVIPAFATTSPLDHPSPVCSAIGTQSNPVAVSHPSSGAIFAWQDERSGNSDIYIQRLCGECDTLTMDWAHNGVPVCTAKGDQQHPVIICDSNGNTIIAWEDNRNGNADVYVQKVDAWGVVQWADDGVALCISPFDQQNLTIASDSAGGAIIVWEDKRNVKNLSDIYAQWIKSNGTVAWSVDGVPVCVETADQHNPRVIWNVRSFAMITWQDKRSGDYDIYAQRLDTSGAAHFVANGVAVCSAAEDQANPQMIDDGSDGVIIVWQDFRSTIDTNIFTQRIGPSGATLWAADGLVMNNNSKGDQRNPVLVTDGKGGAIIVWEDNHGADNDIYGQRVNASGGVEWTPTGVSICTAPGDQVSPRIVRLYRGGADIAWVDRRAATSDIYLQRIAADGVLKTAAGGMAIASANGNQTDPVIISDRNDGSIVAWMDFRNNDNDIYTQIRPGESVRVRWRATAPSFMSPKAEFRIDHAGKIHYNVAIAGKVLLAIRDVSGRSVITMSNGHQNPGSYSISISDHYGRDRIPCGVYFCTLTTTMGESAQRISLIR